MEGLRGRLELLGLRDGGGAAPDDPGADSSLRYISNARLVASGGGNERVISSVASDIRDSRRLLLEP